MRQWLMVLLAGGFVACASGETDPPHHGVLRLVHDGTCTLIPPDGPGFTDVTLLNSTGQIQRATLVRLDDSTTDSAAVAWYTSHNSRPPAGVEWIGGPGVTPPGDSSVVILHLPAGRYIALCIPVEPDSGSSGAPPMASFGLDSAPIPLDQEPPLTDAILQIGTDSVTWIPTPAAGRRIVRITNERPGNVTVSLNRLDDGDRPEILGGITELGPRREGWIVVTFQPGRHEVIVAGGERSAPRSAPEVATRFVIE